MVDKSVKVSSERVLNLLYALRTSRRGVSKSTIRDTVPGYEGLSTDAFNRKFERDKAVLRSININITSTRWADAAGGGEAYVYRITDDDYALAPIDFTPGELEVLRTASNWLPPTGPAARVLTKLRGLGIDLTTEHPKVHAGALNNTLIAQCLAATESKRPIRFTYRKAGGQLSMRNLFPYGVQVIGPRSYVIGYDLDREAIRSFRLSRVEGKIKHHPNFRAQAYDIPADFDPREHLRTDNSVTEVVLKLRPGSGELIRRQASSLLSGSVDPGNAGWDTVTLHVKIDKRFRAELLALGKSVEVCAPESLKDEHARARVQTIQALRACVNSGSNQQGSSYGQ